MIATAVKLHQCSTTSHKPFCVLITSATNSAVETCLQAVAERMQQMLCNVKVAKLGRDGETIKTWISDGNVELLQPGKFSTAFMQQHNVCIIGSTPWRLKKCKVVQENPSSTPF